jgi:hypothetical protein
MTTGKLIQILMIAMVSATWVIFSHSEPFRSHFGLNDSMCSSIDRIAGRCPRANLPTP